MTQTPEAGWFVDPEDPRQLRWWDGSAWTEHRAPRGSTTGDQLSKAGADLADGVAKGLTAVSNWMNQNVATRQHPTFASVAASCRDEEPREPLSAGAELVLTPAEVAAVGALLGPALGPHGGRLPDQPCRLVPNPWDPAVPNGVAVHVGSVQVGRLPAQLEERWCPPLAQLASGGVLATARADLWAQGTPGAVTAARVTVRLPELAAFA